jgi:hypothetical protein
MERNYVIGISLITYDFKGRIITDRVLIIESEGRIIAHALTINLLGIGNNESEALVCLKEVIKEFIADSDDFENELIKTAPFTLFELWEKIFLKTNPGAHDKLDPSSIETFPQAVREEVPA